MRKFFQTNPSTLEWSAQHGGTPLLLAAADSDYPTVAELLDGGADANAHDKFGHTALHNAANFGWQDPEDAIKTIDLLLRAGAEINPQMENGVTPLMMASYRRQRAIVEHLLKCGADPNVRRDDGSTILGFIENAPSLRQNTKRLVKLLKQYGATV